MPSRASWLPISTTCPSFMTIILSTFRQIPILCETITAVFPRDSSRNRFRISVSATGSRAAVGSSSSRMFPLRNMQRARASLCHWPPESWRSPNSFPSTLSRLSLPARSARPTLSSSSSISAVSPRASHLPIPTFSLALSSYRTKS